MTRIGRIVLWDEDEVNDSLWMPLIVFLARAKDEDVHQAFVHPIDFRDFMLMHGVERKPRPFLYVYKHVESRREVAVDKDGSPYRFLPNESGGQYRTSTFHRAIWQLDPIFIRDARAHRRGEYVDRYEMYEADDLVEWAPPPDEPPEPSEPHLRLVR